MGFGVSPARLSHSKFKLHLKTAAHAFAFACVALHSKVDGQAAVRHRLEGKTKFAHAGRALDIRRVDVSPVHFAPSFGVEFIVKGRADVRGEHHTMPELVAAS